MQVFINTVLVALSIANPIVSTSSNLQNASRVVESFGQLILYRTKYREIRNRGFESDLEDRKRSLKYLHATLVSQVNALISQSSNRSIGSERAVAEVSLLPVLMDFYIELKLIDQRAGFSQFELRSMQMARRAFQLSLTEAEAKFPVLKSPNEWSMYVRDKLPTIKTHIDVIIE